MRDHLYNPCNVLVAHLLDATPSVTSYAALVVHTVESFIQFQMQLSDMATAVKMDEETKSRLEALQAEIKLKTGQKVTQQELLARLVESAVESRAEFIDSFREGSSTLTDDEIARFNQGRISSGVETDEDDIDDILYG